MDTRAENARYDSVVVTGAGACVLAPGSDLGDEVLPWLKSRKMRKFMGKQDELAVIAAGRAAHEAGIAAGEPTDRIGIYLAVGYIPFGRNDIELLATHSIDAGAFSMARFSSVGIEQVNPLLTFRCLPNMPIFHVSLNLGVCGPYFVTYPGIGQFYLALERALAALRRGEIDQALVGGVADQNNFLVDFHFARHGRGEIRHDAAAVLCLERAPHAASRGVALKAELVAMDLDYYAHDPANAPAFEENGRFARHPDAPRPNIGPGSLAGMVHDAVRARRPDELMHSARTADGFVADSRWRVL